MDISKIPNWRAPGEAPPDDLLLEGYLPGSTPDNKHWNYFLYNTFQNLKELATENQGIQRDTNYSIPYSWVNMADVNVPKFIPMSGSNVEGTVGTQTVSESVEKGWAVLENKGQSSGVVSFKGVVEHNKDYDIEWTKADPTLSVPYTVSFDLIGSTSWASSNIAIEVASLGQVFGVEQFKRLDIPVENSIVRRVGFTFRLRKKDVASSNGFMMNFLLSVPGASNGTTTIKVTALNITKGSVLAPYAPAYMNATPKVSAKGYINIASYKGDSCSFSANLASDALGLTAGIYSGIHMKEVTSLSGASTSNMNIQIVSNGLRVYTRKFKDTDVSVTPFVGIANVEDLFGKVDKEPGKGLSSNDYTLAEKNKLSGIATGANKYVLPTASNTVLGGVKVALNSGLEVSAGGTLSASELKNTVDTHVADTLNHIVYCGASTGVDAKVVPSGGVKAYTEGLQVRFKNTDTNTGATTLNIGGLGSKPLYSFTGEEHSGGELIGGMIYNVVYNGTAFFLASGSGGLKKTDLTALITNINKELEA